MGKIRGRYKCVAVPAASASAAAAAASSPSAVAASSSDAAAAASPSKVTGGAWVGPEWRNTPIELNKPKTPQPSLEELRKNFPGLDHIAAENEQKDPTQRTLFHDPHTESAAMDMDMTDAPSSSSIAATTPKIPVTSLSRCTPSKSRTVSRMGTPAASAPASPSLSAQSSPAADGSSMDMSAISTPAAKQTPQRIPLSGARWKVVGQEIPAHRLASSGVIKSKTLNRSWNAKQQRRQALREAKEQARKIAEMEREERRERARRAAQRAKQREENERKSSVVQVISDTRKIKKMSRKQLSKLQKMDTNGMPKGTVTTGTLARGLVPKGQ